MSEAKNNNTNNRSPSSGNENNHQISYRDHPEKEVEETEQEEGALDTGEKGAEDKAQEMKDMGEAVKDGASLAKNAATGNVVGAAKDAVKLAMNKTVRKKVIRNYIISTVASISLFLALAGFFLGIFDAVGNAVQSLIDLIIGFFTTSEDDGSIQITTNQIDQIIDTIDSMGVSVEDLKLLGDYSENATEEQKQEELRKYIRKFYEAQAVTQTLNYYHKDSTSSKTYGAVYVYRTNGGDDISESNRKNLTYKKYEDMNKMVKENNTDALNYFSIDSSGNLVYVGSSRIVVETGSDINNLSQQSDTTTLQMQTIDYKNLVSQYTTQMNFLLYLTMISQNPEFVSAVTDLIKDSRIEITIMDSTSTNVNTETYTYTLNTRTREENTSPNSTVVTYTYEESSSDVTEITKTTTTNVQPTPKVTYVKTWFCEQYISYNKKTTNNSNSYDIDPPPSDERKPSGEGTWKTNQNRHIDSSIDNVFYEEGTRGDVKLTLGQAGDGERYRKGEISEPTFVGLMETEYKIPYSSRTEEAGSNLVSGAEMLFYLLQKDSRLENMETLMRYALYLYSGKDFGVTNIDTNIFAIRDFTVVGNLSAFGTTLTREQFIQMATDYGNTLNSSDYNTYIIPYLGDFYDIATSSQYNVNPALVLAHACLETGFGSSNACKNDRNYFGMAHYNGANSGSKYATVADSIEDYCAWVVNNATPGTSAYSSNLARGQEYAQGNELLSGTPDTNIYVLYCRYAYLGDTHISDEPDFSNPAGTSYYASHGSDWGSGGRIYIYTMYETGGLYTGEYATRCGHSSGSDLTTVTERADYAVYSCNQRIQIAKDIFGDAVFSGEGTTNVGGVDVETYTSSSGKTYVQYKQNVGSWANMTYGDNTIAYQGCSITSLAITMSGYGYNYTPAQWSGPLISMSGQLRSYLPGSSTVQIIGDQQAYLTVQPNNKSDIQNHLKTGNPVIIHVLGKGSYSSSYTSNQHWMVLLDINDDGSQVYVSNPYSTGKNGWDSIDEVLRSLCCYIKVSP